MEYRRRERLRRQWISTIASAVALVVALGLMAIADVGPAAIRPERVLDFGAGPRGDHAGNGNALIPDAPASPPVARPPSIPGSETGPPISANIVAVRPALVVDDVNATLPTSTTTATRPPSTTTTSVSTTTTTTLPPERSPNGKSAKAHRPHRPHTAHTPHKPKPKRTPHKPKRPKHPRGPYSDVASAPERSRRAIACVRVHKHAAPKCKR